eukprot:TRINITY_DN5387_c0_g2_i1.p1 TRINITY_DN5387_c0_g2~~TRINITY_DN5387_c0_g2_i1.p1  ORF type:complete len:308 (+),score=62.66 TRINITY_DN5387_c0_g2_i1:54-926(+)
MASDEQKRTAETRTQQQPEYACALCGESRLSPKRCSLCREVFYCSPGCQKSHWSSEHNRTCPRIFKPPPTASKKVENPCVKCGKPGTKQNSGVWYCSNECYGREMDILTKSIKRAANPESKYSNSNDAAVSSFITSVLEKNPVADVPTQLSASDDNDRLRNLIKQADSKEVWQQEGNTPHAGTTPTGSDDRLRDIISKADTSNSKKVSVDALREKERWHLNEMNRLKEQIKEAEEASATEHLDSPKQTLESVSGAAANADEMISSLKETDANFSSSQSNKISKAELEDLD